MRCPSQTWNNGGAGVFGLYCWPPSGGAQEVLLHFCGSLILYTCFPQPYSLWNNYTFCFFVFLFSQQQVSSMYRRLVINHVPRTVSKQSKSICGSLVHLQEGRNTRRVDYPLKVNWSGMVMFSRMDERNNNVALKMLKWVAQYILFQQPCSNILHSIMLDKVVTLTPSLLVEEPDDEPFHLWMCFWSTPQLPLLLPLFRLVGNMYLQKSVKLLR